MNITPTHRTFFSSDGHMDENGLSLTVEALLLDRYSELPDPLTAHTEQCDRCKEQVLGLFELMKEQPMDRTVPHPYFDKASSSRHFSSYLRAAAILAAALITGALFFQFSTRNARVTHPVQTANTPVATPIDTVSTPPARNDDLLADHFSISPNLDDLVNSEFRSEMIEVLAPEIEAIVQPPITFQWKQYPRPVILKVLNNKDITVLTSSVKGNKFVTSKIFPEGLYYWKLEDNGELLYVGKFFVR